MAFRQITGNNRVEFKRDYFPNHEFRVCSSDEEPYENPRENEFPVPLSFIVDAGLRFPLEPLLVRLINRTRIALHRWAINSIRIVLGVSRLNHILRLDLGLPELFYCYQIIRAGSGDSVKFYLKARSAERSLVVALPSSNKDKSKEVLAVFGGDISSLPDLEVPIIFGEGPDRAIKAGDESEFNTLHVNLALNHIGSRAPLTLRKHPRAAHRLLGYAEGETTFTSQPPEVPAWVGEEPEEEERFLLFYEHRVRNPFARAYHRQLEKDSDGPEGARGTAAARATIAEAIRRRELRDRLFLGPNYEADQPVDLTAEIPVVETEAIPDEPTTSGRDFDESSVEPHLDWDRHFTPHLSPHTREPGMDPSKIPNLLDLIMKKSGSSDPSPKEPAPTLGERAVIVPTDAPVQTASAPLLPKPQATVAGSEKPKGADKSSEKGAEKRPREEGQKDGRGKKQKAPPASSWVPNFSRGPLNFDKPLLQQDKKELLKFAAAVTPPRDAEYLDKSSLEQLTASAAADIVAAAMKLMRITPKACEERMQTLEAEKAAASARNEASTAKAEKDAANTRAEELASQLEKEREKVRALEQEKSTALAEKVAALSEKDSLLGKVAELEADLPKKMAQAQNETMESLTSAYQDQVTRFSEWSYHLGYSRALDNAAVSAESELRKTFSTPSDFWSILGAKERDRIAQSEQAPPSVFDSAPPEDVTWTTGAGDSGAETAAVKEKGKDKEQ